MVENCNEQTLRPLIIGHRGAAGEAPENTLASFELAVRQGADAVELDVHLTADGELVVCHDHTVNRTTDGQGRIDQMTVEQIKRLDAGRWYDERFRGERIPLLSEVFAALPANVMINVEVKCGYSDKLSGWLAELLAGFGRLETTVVSSFSHKVLYRLKQREPAIRVGLLYVADLVRHSVLAETAGMDVYSLHPQYQAIGPEDVAEAQRHGLRVYPFTINEPEHLRQAVQAGCSGIITDFPARLKAMLG
ncbi:glycerophosphodiester phosphodiesterase [Paenibacillus validus]|uniref:glycerophosphodiester phosphodiesterase n=1 Tax=Paenibacillus validus TaxID=44253 RepID=UPI003D26717C